MENTRPERAYIIQLDAKKYFPNWDKMTKEEQEKWKSRIKARKRPRKQ